MSAQTNQRLIRTTTAFALIVAIVAFVTIPTVFLLTAISYENNRLQGEAEASAARISRLVYSNPRHWQFQLDRLEELLTEHGYNTPRRQTIVDMNDTEIIVVGPPHDHFSIHSEATVSDGRRPIATVTTSQSLWPLISQTVAISAVSALLSIAIFLVLRTYPLRALKRTVSDLERSESDLRAAKDAAEIANRSKSEFLANMSHELRTPLNAVIGFSGIIENETFGPVGNQKYRGYATDIKDSGEHLLDLINDILDLSKIESGIDELREDDIDVPKVIRMTDMLVRERSARAGIQLVYDCPSELPKLRADERKLKQMVLNLLANAIKFSEPPGQVTLTVRCRDDGGYIFQFVDTGIGMVPHDIPTALSKFGQIDAGLARRHEGTGLGLPLTKSLIEQHGGSMTLLSELGVGTTVTLSFPAERTVHTGGTVEIIPIAPRLQAI